MVFDKSHSELCFAARWLGAPVAGDAPSALELARCMAQGTERREPMRWAERARAAARALAMTAELSGPKVAQVLGVHPRTLRRRLAEEGIGLRGVFDTVRADLARELLKQTQLPLADIAATLGFADSSALASAFRGWAGSTPSRWSAQP